MELYTLKVFMTVATERSFSRAAEILLRSQPAITQAVQKLEREFGEQLLDRTARDLTLTDSRAPGDGLLPPFREPRAGTLGRLRRTARRRCGTACDWGQRKRLRSI